MHIKLMIVMITIIRIKIRIKIIPVFMPECKIPFNNSFSPQNESKKKSF